MKTLPILFNTDMVRALLEGRKTVTRRVIKPQPKSRLAFVSMGSGACRWSYPSASAWKYWGDESYKLAAGLTDEDRGRRWAPPCCAGDVLYVRETWCVIGTDGMHDEYGYRADGIEYGTLWHPSIHMPKEAARIFLRVKGVRVERLQGITEDQAMVEGAGDPYDYQAPEWYEKREEFAYSSQIAAFAGLWDSTVKPADRDKYGWDADPWVWVIEFERISREEAGV